MVAIEGAGAGWKFVEPRAVSGIASTEEILMNKKPKTRAAKTSLTLKTEAVKRLTGDMLKDVAGGMIPATRVSHCATACTDC